MLGHLCYNGYMENKSLSDKVLFYVSQNGRLAVSYFTRDMRVYSHYTFAPDEDGIKECLKRMSREKSASLLFTEEFIAKAGKGFDKSTKKFAKSRIL